MKGDKTVRIIIPKEKDIPACANVYIEAYKAEPWNEVYETSEVEKYISEYMNSSTKCCYALVENEEIMGVALGLIVPCISVPFFRIEDFCVNPNIQRKGYGSSFMDLLLKEVVKKGCDSVLLGTQKGYPSHRFYVKNGFQEIESVLLYKEMEEIPNV